MKKLLASNWRFPPRPFANFPSFPTGSFWKGKLAKNQRFNVFGGGLHPTKAVRRVFLPKPLKTNVWLGILVLLFLMLRSSLYIVEIEHLRILKMIHDLQNDHSMQALVRNWTYQTKLFPQTGNLSFTRMIHRSRGSITWRLCQIKTNRLVGTIHIIYGNMYIHIVHV